MTHNIHHLLSLSPIRMGRSVALARCMFVHRLLWYPAKHLKFNCGQWERASEGNYGLTNPAGNLREHLPNFGVSCACSLEPILGTEQGVNQCSGLIPFDKPHHRLMLVYNPICIYVTICLGSFQANSLDMYTHTYIYMHYEAKINWSCQEASSQSPKSQINPRFASFGSPWIAEASHFSGKMSRLVLICGPIVSVACGDPAASPISRSSPWKVMVKDHQNLEVQEVIMKKCSKNWNELDFMTIHRIYQNRLNKGSSILRF